jgi:CheY-like chemotaxis protein
LARAFEHIRAAIEPRVRTVLLAWGEDEARSSALELLGTKGLEIQTASRMEDALAALETRRYDCAVVDAAFADSGAVPLIEAISAHPEWSETPVILHADSDLPLGAEKLIGDAAGSLILRRVRGPEELLSEAALFLHRPEEAFPEPARRLLERARESHPELSDRTVLIVDDDVRNIFALTSVLERQGITVLHAETGAAGIEALLSSPEIELVLMDVMMPVMDGYDTIRAIREDERFRSLPIIAVTAKAMKGDRDKCLQSGASDYITKPVDLEELLSLLRVWLPERWNPAASQAATPTA